MYVTLAISIISIVLAIATGIFSYRYNKITLRNSAKIEHQKILLDINKLLISDPALWTIYDDHAMNEHVTNTPELVARKEAFIYYYLNFFDVVYEFYNKHIIKNKNDKLTWDSWKEYIESFIRRSSQAREIIKRDQHFLYETDLEEFYTQFVNAHETKMELKKPFEL